MRISNKMTVKPRLVVGAMLLSFFSTTTMIGSIAQAAVYKKVDAEGNVSFTDVPDRSAQLVNVAPLETVPALSPDVIAKTLNDDDSQKNTTANVNYTIRIISPKADQTYHRSVDAFSANVEVKPNLQEGDHLVFLVDGKTSDKTIPPNTLDRGQHQFEARVVSAKGRVLKSLTTTFFVQQPTAR
jgi:flagellar hook assembly protein FlgD